MSLRKRKSNIHGTGIFTDSVVQRGECFYTVPIEKIFSKPHKRCARIGENIWVSDPAILNYVNHSCRPNTHLMTVTQLPCLKAKRTIKPGEEVTVDYSVTEQGKKKITCSCGILKCKGYFMIA